MKIAIIGAGNVGATIAYTLATQGVANEVSLIDLDMEKAKGDVRVGTVPDPKIQHPRDAIIKITACAICGSDWAPGCFSAAPRQGKASHRSRFSACPATRRYVQPRFFLKAQAGWREIPLNLPKRSVA